MKTLISLAVLSVVACVGIFGQMAQQPMMPMAGGAAGASEGMNVVVIVHGLNMLDQATLEKTDLDAFANLDDAAGVTGDISRDIKNPQEASLRNQPLVSAKNSKILSLLYVNGKVEAIIMNPPAGDVKLEGAIENAINMLSGAGGKRLIIIVGGHDSIQDTQKIHQLAQRMSQNNIMLIAARPGYFVPPNIDYAALEREAEASVPTTGAATSGMAGQPGMMAGMPAAQPMAMPAAQPMMAGMPGQG